MNLCSGKTSAKPSACGRERQRQQQGVGIGGKQAQVGAAAQAGRIRFNPSRHGTSICTPAPNLPAYKETHLLNQVLHGSVALHQAKALLGLHNTEREQCGGRSAQLVGHGQQN